MGIPEGGRSGSASRLRRLADAGRDAISALPAPWASATLSRVEPTTTPRPRNNFDALRLLAALLIVYSHQTLDQTGTAGLRLVMFFSISGFLVAGSWGSDPHGGRFLARRFLRVWPAYAVLILACSVATWLFPAHDMPEISRLASRFYLSNLWQPGFDWGFFPGRDPMMNRSLWMLPYEIDLYLAFVLVAWLGRGARIVVAAVLLLAAVGAPQTTFAVGGVLDCWSLYFGGFFAFGVLLRELPRLRGDTIVALCIACGIVTLLFGDRTTGLLLVIPPGAVWIGQHSWPVVRAAARFGDLSFGVFLWSFPVQQVTRLWLDPKLPAMLQLAIVLLQVLPIAWLSYRFVEAPALRCKPPRPARVTGPSDDAKISKALRAWATRWTPRRSVADQPAVERSS
jgi:peptidoglycan/LPS O-acetylase OafA/YrhL